MRVRARLPAGALARFARFAVGRRARRTVPRAPPSRRRAAAADSLLRYAAGCATAPARRPRRAHADDAGLDLHAAEAAEVAPGGRASVGTGVALALDDGLAGLVLPRSGLAARHGLDARQRARV